MSVYQRTVEVAGVPVKCETTVKGWGGWPDDCVAQIERWNKNGKLSFYGMNFWSPLATGFKTLTHKCPECGEFFNNTGTFTCCFAYESRSKKIPVCDDCMITLARSEIGAAAA